MFGFLAPVTQPSGLNLRLSVKSRRPMFGSWTLTRTKSKAPATWRDYKDGVAIATRKVKRGDSVHIVTAERYDPTDPADKGLEILYAFALVILMPPVGMLMVWIMSWDPSLKTRLELVELRSVELTKQ